MTWSKEEIMAYVDGQLPESEILSEFYQVNDIDIPVEVKADWPINVDIDQQDNWQQVRQI